MKAAQVSERPRERRFNHFLHPLVSSAQPLLQSRHDAVTEYEGGPAMARALNGSLITVEGGDHGTFGRGNKQVDDAVMTYLDTGRVTIDHADQAPLAA